MKSRNNDNRFDRGPRRALRRMLLVATALAATLAAAPAASAEFSITEFEASSTSTEAGGHPDVRTFMRYSENEIEQADGHVRRIEVDLPLGQLGVPSATPVCEHDEFATSSCPAASKVGSISVKLNKLGEGPGLGVYNLVPADSEPALLGIDLGVIRSFVRISVKADGGVRATVDDLPFDASLLMSDMTLWGVPADHNESGAPRQPFMSAPTRCDGQPVTTLKAMSWEDSTPRLASSLEPPLTDCENVPFEPSIETAATNPRAGEPTGLDFAIGMPYDESPDGRVTAHLRDASITLPAGMAMNPSAADGLAGCSDAQFAIETTAPPRCPDASRIGTVAIESPASREALTGAVFIAEQKAGDPYRMLISVEAVGVRVKLAGSIKPDPVTGQLTTVFEDSPQLPFTRLELTLKDGPRAPLVAPPSCGVYATQFRLTSWAGDDVSGSSALPIDQGCASRLFSFGFEAGSTELVAGASTGFAMKLERGGAAQEFKGIEMTLPPGLLADIGSVPRCAEAQANSGACGPESKIGSVKVAAGAGATPFWAPQAGKQPTAVYLAGPYQGYPFSLSAVVPAQAGPFDLGRVVARVGVKPDPRDTRVSAPLLESRIYGTDGALQQVVSGGIPRILAGIPLNVRTIGLAIDRAGFMRNPTNCRPKAVEAKLSSQQGASGSASSRFQVADCGALGFKPRLSLSLKGGTKRDQNPALTAVMNARPGDANIGRVAVALPRSQFLDQDHIRTVCTRVQFAAKQCPPGSVYGFAEASTPLLDQPLKGPVYLRSSDNPLPDLVAALGGQIEIELVGRIDSVNQGIRTTFDLVPDAPVTQFTLRMKGGKKSLLVNSRDICAKAYRATAQMNGQNGRFHDFRPALKNRACGKRSSKR